MNEEEKKIQKELDMLRKEHQDLDGILTDGNTDPIDQLSVQRLKKRKLWLKDRILAIEANMYPDIIA